MTDGAVSTGDPDSVDREWVIYGLTDPRSGDVRYVGFTVNLRTRLRDHQKPSQLTGKTRRDRWIAGLKRIGLAPGVIEIEHGRGPEWGRSEIAWIAHYRAIFPDLTNHTLGGEGTPGRQHTDDAKARMSAKRKGVKPTPQAIAASIAIHTGRKQSAAQVEHRVSFIRGVTRSPELRERIAAKLRGRKLPPEHCANIAAAAVGRVYGPMSEEQKLKVSATKTGVPNTWKRDWWAAKTPEERSEIAKARYAKWRAKREE
jgi:hypothetical protein